MQPAELSFSVPAYINAILGGAGILTCFPSPTPFGLGLGFDSPWEDYPTPGNLGLTATGFLARFIATHARIVTPHGR